MMKAVRPAWMEPPTRLMLTGKAIVLTMVVIVVVYPFLSVISTSLATEQDVSAGGGMVLIPKHPTLDAYQTIFDGGTISKSIWVAIGITTMGTLASLVVTAMLAYALSRPIVGGRFILMMALLTLLFPP